jgi:glycosyltransferase involved in cell wall biosynthesis
LNANFIYSDLNPCGGGERLTLVTMEAVLEMGIDIDLTTLKTPDITKITNAFGKELAAVINRIKKVNLLQHILDKQSNDNFSETKYDITINTHGDIDPYYNDSFSKNNAITYCHYPSAKYFMESDNLEYLEKHIKIAEESSLSENFICTPNSQRYGSQNIVNFDRKSYLECLRYTYDKMIKNSTIITNSEYSRKAIFEAYFISDSIVINPPVDVDIFQKSLILSTSPPNDEKDDYILVISRIEPSKRIENAIKLAKLLKEKKIGKAMRIVGNFESYYYDYYVRLKKMIVDFNLTDYVFLEIDTTFDTLVLLMKESKVYFHPRFGEHFGISIVEAMSAGLIPVVSDDGGQTEFVPLKYQYHTIEQAAQIISLALKTPYSERALISNSVKKFSSSNYKRSFQQVVNKLIVKK